MAWCSFFYQSGMSGQDSFRLPNGDDLPLPEPRHWGGASANINVDFVNIPPPRRLRVHYRIEITALGPREGTLLRTTHISELTGSVLDLARDQAVGRTVPRMIQFCFGSRWAPRLAGAAASITQSSPIAGDSFIRLVDADRAFTYIIVR